MNGIYDTGSGFGNVDKTSLSDLQTNNNIVVPSINITFSDTTIHTLQQTFDSFVDDGNHGIDLFCNLVQFLEVRHS